MLQMNHEHAMNRLTNMLRNAQTTCTDTECLTGPCKNRRLSEWILSKYCRLFCFLVPGQPNTTGGGTGMMNVYLMLGLWLAIAFLLFIFRPRTLRNNREQPGKSNQQVGRIASSNLGVIHSIYSSLRVVMVKILQDLKCISSKPIPSNLSLTIDCIFTYFSIQFHDKKKTKLPLFIHLNLSWPYSSFNHINRLIFSSVEPSSSISFWLTYVHIFTNQAKIWEDFYTVDFLFSMYSLPNSSLCISLEIFSSSRYLLLFDLINHRFLRFISDE